MQTKSMEIHIGNDDSSVHALRVAVISEKFIVHILRIHLNRTA